MQFSLLAFASLLAAVTAQNGVPTCAAGCVRNLPSQCATQDIGCICGDSSFITNVSCCVFKSCPQSDQAGKFIETFAYIRVGAEKCRLPALAWFFSPLSPFQLADNRYLNSCSFVRIEHLPGWRR